MKVRGILLAILLFSCMSKATTYYVSTTGSDTANGLSWNTAFKTVQKGVTSSANYDTVILAEGTYQEVVTLGGKRINLKSTDPDDPDVVDATIINANDTTKDVLTCNSGETSATIIEGITLTGGRRGISVSSSSTPSITKCVVKQNNSYGIYIYVSSGSITISKCTMKNQSSSYGFYGYGNVTLQNCLSVKNKYGIYVSSSTGTFDIINCTVADNTTSGITGSADVVTNSIMWNNKDDYSSSISPACVPTYCCIEDGDAGTGNIGVDPMFVDSSNNDYHLTFGSYGIDAGNPSSAYSNEPAGGGGRIDMGAYGNTGGATTISDTDEDGIADEWEEQYWPNDDPNQHNPNDDPDGDGLRNNDEFRTNWDPTTDDSSNIIGFVTNQDTGYRYPSISYAARLAFADDILVMDPNHFVETVNINGKHVHLRSTDPNDPDVVAATIIDANDTSKDVLTCNSGETSATIIEGITLTGGKYGIYVTSSSAPSIIKCVVKQNNSSGMSINVSSGSGPMIVSKCTVTQNGGYGFTGFGDVTLKNCLFVDNDSFGVSVSDGSGTFTIENCTIANNNNYGAYGRFDEIKDSILWGNENDVHNVWSSYTISYCCVEDGDAGTGNISSNPQFVDAANGDYHLSTNSPCIDAGDPLSDFSDEPQGGGGRIDMGAYGNTEGATVILDGDSDGIPDAWERHYWPYDNPSQHNPNDDPDADGLTNMEEYLIDWDPTHDDSSSIPGFVTNQRTEYRFPSVNLAMDFAEDNDILVMDPNHFVETVNINGKHVHLRSTDPNDPDVVAATIIDANDTSKDVLTCNSGETSATIIEGITLTGGRHGIYIPNSCTPSISKCVIQQNDSSGMYIMVSSGSMTISKCTVTHNGGYGFTGFGDVTLKNCLFVNNDSWGIYISDGSGTFTIENCTVADNHDYGVYGQFDVIYNSILWGNGNDVHNIWSSYTISYCCVEDEDAGTGNISSNPQFVDAANGDYHLKSTEGRWTGSNWVTDGINSPCIDAGQPWADFSQEPAAANGERVNMGAYGNTSAASKSIDTDSDGLSDAWEMYNFGNLNQNPTGTGGNYDNDDFDNQIEYCFNYDPNAITQKDIEIVNLHQSVSSFNPTLDETVTFDFWMNKPLRLRLQDADSNDIFFDSQTEMSPGHSQIVWDGTAISDQLIVLNAQYDWTLTDAAQTPSVTVGSKDSTTDTLVPIALAYDHSVGPLYCNPTRMIPTYNEITTISYGISLGNYFNEWPMSVRIYDPDGNLFFTVIEDVNQNKSSSQQDLRTVTWYGKNGPPEEPASRYPSKFGEYTVRVQFSGMRECATKTIYVFKQ